MIYKTEMLAKAAEMCYAKMLSLKWPLKRRCNMPTVSRQEPRKNKVWGFTNKDRVKI